MGQKQGSDLGRIEAAASAYSDHHVSAERSSRLKCAVDASERQLGDRLIKDLHIDACRLQAVDEHPKILLDAQSLVSDYQGLAAKRRCKSGQGGALTCAEDQVSRATQSSKQRQGPSSRFR